MKQLLFSTNNHWTGFVTRVVLGLILLPHGLQKTFGLFGGYGFSGTMNYFTVSLHFPWLLGFLVILSEFAGALLLLLGLATRFWAVAIICLMIGTIVTVHRENGFFMNRSGTNAGEGFEYHIAIICLSLVLLLNGAGTFSIDKKMQKLLTGKKQASN